MFKRLSTQIYLTIVLTLLVVVLVAGGLWRFSGGERQLRQAVTIAGELLANGLPPATAPESVQREAALKLAKRLRLDLVMYSASGERIAQFGRQMPHARERASRRGGLIRGHGGPMWAVPLPDGRMIIAGMHRQRPVPPPVRLIFILGAAALVVALCAWPVVRGLTRRLERLQVGVDRFGAGDLSARVAIKGRDEVAKLADSFNTSAARIEALVGAHKLLLANASHELRTPLSRIRMGIELQQQSPSPERREALERDIAEVDDLIEEILLLSRLDALGELEEHQDVDLLALAAEEASRYPGCDVSGEAVLMSGDARLLRRLIRNLIENAIKHGAPPIGVNVHQDGSEVVLTVSDEGPGVTEKLAEQVFEPFHRGASRGKNRWQRARTGARAQYR